MTENISNTNDAGTSETVVDRRSSHCSSFCVGDKVRITNDGDGSAGKIATIGKVYKSGRCRVDLPQGGFRNLAPKCLEAVE